MEVTVKLVSVPDPKPTPARIAFSIANFTRGQEAVHGWYSSATAD